MERRQVLRISDDKSLSAAGDAIHDAFFAGEDVSWDEPQGVFRLAMWRELTELRQERRIIPFVYRVVTPHVRSELAIRLVRRASVQVTDGIGLKEYCLDDIRYDQEAGAVRIAVTGPLVITLSVGALCAELWDIGEPNWEYPSIPTLAFHQKPRLLNR